MKKEKNVCEPIDLYADKPIAIAEAVDMENHVIATYWIQADKGMDMSVIGQVLAIEQTTGTWTPVPGRLRKSGRSMLRRLSACTRRPTTNMPFRRT